MSKLARPMRRAAAAAHGRAGGSLDPERDELLARARARAMQPLGRRELAPSLVLAGVFVAGAAVMALLLDSSRSFSLVPALLLVVAYAVTSRIEFEVAGGCAVPTQLVFVPMLFLQPAHYVPLLVAAGFAVGNIVDHVRGSRHMERVLPLLATSIHSLGPAALLSLAGEPQPTWSNWPIFAAALGSQFTLDFLTSVAHEWLRSRVRPSLQLRLMGIVYLVDLSLAPVGLIAVAATSKLPYAYLAYAPLAVLLAVFARERRDRIGHALELGHAYRGTAFLLGDVVEADDAYTGDHSRQVVGLVVAVADELGLDGRERQRAELTALLHDVGKLRIPNEIVNKPGPLTEDERALMQTHTVIGERLLERVGGLLQEVGQLVRSCHERWDGKGYPDGLLADETPLVARIVCCCDAYNAMVTTRPYRAALPQAQAIEELRRNAGTQFDPMVVRALLSVLDRHQADIVHLPVAA